jgi:hypothetical protein
MGTVRKDLTSLPLRFWVLTPYPNYFIVHVSETTPLQIIHILHWARNIPPLVR